MRFNFCLTSPRLVSYFLFLLFLAMAFATTDHAILCSTVHNICPANIVSQYVKTECATQIKHEKLGPVTPL